MAPTNEEVLATIREKLSKGDVAGASAAAAVETDEQKAAAAEAAKKAAPEGPRSPEVIVVDILKAMKNILGNHPTLQPLFNELDEVLKKP